MATSNQERRRETVVDIGFQKRFVWKLTTALFLFFALFLCIGTVSPALCSLMGLQPSWLTSASLFQADVLLPLVFLPVLGTGICLYLFGIRESFRIAGPHYRFKAVFACLQNRQIPRGVVIRRKDYMQDSAEELNHGLEVMHDTFVLLKQQAQDAVNAFGSSSAEESRQSGMRKLEQLQLTLSQVRLLSTAPECVPVECGELVEPMDAEALQSRQSESETPV